VAPVADSEVLAKGVFGGGGSLHGNRGGLTGGRSPLPQWFRQAFASANESDVMSGPKRDPYAGDFYYF
jgi:hypothetical protein